MKGTMPIITCDEDSGGCTDWTTDWYEACASNWAELMEGWQYDPYKPAALIYCPSHRTDQGAEEGTPDGSAG